MAITDVIVPVLRHGSLRELRPDLNSTSDGCTASWTAWETTAYVTVTDPAMLPAARQLVVRQFAAAEKAAARFRSDAELHKLYRAGGRTITVSPMLADLIAAALMAAERTDGDVDPTVGAAMTAVHSGRRAGSRDRSGLPTCGSRPTWGRPAPGWQQVDLRGRRLQVPPGTTLDLSATAKAVACDRAVAEVQAKLGIGVLVGLGGNVATAGPAPDGGWPVTIHHRTGVGQSKVFLPAGAALATSHFRAHLHGDDAAAEELGSLGHLIDPHTGREPAAVWQTASAIGFNCLEAAMYAAAALVRGPSARAWLARLWIPARLVTVSDDVITVGPWNLHIGNETRRDGNDAADSANPSFPTPRVANPRRTIF